MREKRRKKVDSKVANFEKSIQELEELTRKLERGSLSLEESIWAYERGMELSEICRTILQKAERKLEYLKESKNGDIERVRVNPEEVDKTSSEASHVDQTRLFQ